jgi:sarcosine oxidase
MMEHYDAIVIGGGVMGSAAAYHLARRGRRALLLEQFAIGHERGSSHGHSRIIRLVYDLPEYVQLARAAYPLWHELEQESGAELLLETGGLDFADSDLPSVQQTRATLLATGVPFEALDRAAIAERFPQFALPEGAVGIYQPNTGILNASQCVAELARVAERYGAAIHAEEPARAIRAVAGAVEVQTDRATYAADRLIVTAGSWAGGLLAQLGLDLPLTVTREQVAFFTPREPEQFMPGRCPIFVRHVEQGPAIYGFPIFGLPGVKAAFHGAGPAIDPSSEERDVDQAQLDALGSDLARWMPGAAGPVLQAQTCRYTCTPDHDFIVDLHPEHPQVVVGSPCSGHGFKFGAIIGSILADLAERGATDQPIERFRLARFTSAPAA